MGCQFQYTSWCWWWKKKPPQYCTQPTAHLLQFFVIFLWVTTRWVWWKAINSVQFRPRPNICLNIRVLPPAMFNSDWILFHWLPLRLASSFTPTKWLFFSRCCCCCWCGTRCSGWTSWMLPGRYLQSWRRRCYVWQWSALVVVYE